MITAVQRLKDWVGCALALGATPRDRWALFWRETTNLRVRLGLARYNPAEVYSVETRYGRLHFRNNFGDVTNLVALMYHEIYRPLTPPGAGAILDIGANIGLAAAWYAHRYPGRPIYCFEPLASNAALIPLNSPSAHVETVALGARRGRVSLYVDWQRVMASRIPCRWETSVEEFDVVTLDEAVERLDPIALIKIDAEGMENEILEGGTRTLQRASQVVMETHGVPAHQQALAVLKHLGFEIDSEQRSDPTGLIFASRRS